MRLEVRRVVRWSAAVCLAFVLLGVSAPAADPDASARAARTQRGVLVLQVGSDWCVSGENVRKAFESREFARAVEGKYVLAVYDEMDSPTEAVKAKNEQVKDILIRTKRFPALTCYAPGSPLRVFAQIENIPGNVTPAKLAYAVARAAEKKDKAEALFRKAASAGGEAAADLYGEGFDLLAPMMGPFHPGELKKGKAAWTKEWEALKKLDADDRFGWVRHFNFDDYRCIDLLGKCVRDGDAKLARQLLSIPQKHFTPNQKQFMKVLEYARESDGTNRPLSPRGKALLKETLDLGRDTFWGQFAMGRLMMDGEKIESKGLYRAPVRPRPTGGSSAARLPFPLERTKSRLRPLKPHSLEKKQGPELKKPIPLWPGEKKQSCSKAQEASCSMPRPLIIIIASLLTVSPCSCPAASRNLPPPVGSLPCPVRKAVKAGNPQSGHTPMSFSILSPQRLRRRKTPSSVQPVPVIKRYGSVWPIFRIIPLPSPPVLSVVFLQLRTAEHPWRPHSVSA